VLALVDPWWTRRKPHGSLRLVKRASAGRASVIIGELLLALARAAARRGAGRTACRPHRLWPASPCGLGAHPDQGRRSRRRRRARRHWALARWDRSRRARLSCARPGNDLGLPDHPDVSLPTDVDWTATPRPSMACVTAQLDIDSQFDHERVLIERRPEIGLTLIVAIHSTALGPGEGGLRMKRYPRIDDALRLSSAMTLKSAAAGLSFGGGKAVVLEPPGGISRVEVMHAIGDFVEIRLVAQVGRAASRSWQAAAWLLERQYPERWGRRPRTAEGPGDRALAVLSDPFAEVEELAEARRRRERRPRGS
jgi:Glu/Leu/Phe/Val dehydrogenase, dimerisation domain